MSYLVDLDVLNKCLKFNKTISIINKGMESTLVQIHIPIDITCKINEQTQKPKGVFELSTKWEKIARLAHEEMDGTFL